MLASTIVSGWHLDEPKLVVDGFAISGPITKVPTVIPAAIPISSEVIAIIFGFM